MKKFKLFLLLAVLFCGSATFVGCSDDDDNSSALVGKWYSSAFYGGCTLTFYENGRFTEDWWEVKNGSYKYSGSTLTMSFDDGTSHIYIVTMLTESRLVYMNNDGNSYSFSRQ